MKFFKVSAMVVVVVVLLGLLQAIIGQPEPRRDDSSPCDKRGAWEVAGRAVRASFPEGSQMNIPFFKAEYVRVDSVYHVEGWTVVDGHRKYEYTVDADCLEGSGWLVFEVRLRDITDLDS